MVSILFDIQYFTDKTIILPEGAGSSAWSVEIDANGETTKNGAVPKSEELDTVINDHLAVLKARDNFQRLLVHAQNFHPGNDIERAAAWWVFVMNGETHYQRLLAELDKPYEVYETVPVAFALSLIAVHAGKPEITEEIVDKFLQLMTGDEQGSKANLAISCLAQITVTHPSGREIEEGKCGAFAHPDASGIFADRKVTAQKAFAKKTIPPAGAGSFVRRSSVLGHVF